MSRIATFAVAVALSVIAVPAFAQTNDAIALHQGGDKDKKSPTPAAEFRAHVQARQEKMRAKLEEHIAAKKLPEAKANEIRAKFNAAVAKVNEKVEEVCADGTVTKEEAHAVRALAKSLRPRHHKENPTLDRRSAIDRGGPRGSRMRALRRFEEALANRAGRPRVVDAVPDRFSPRSTRPRRRCRTLGRRRSGSPRSAPDPGASSRTRPRRRPRP